MLVGNYFKQLEKQKTHFQLNEKFPNAIGYFQLQFIQQFNCFLLLPIEFEYFQLKNFSIENFPSSLYFKSGSPNKKIRRPRLGIQGRNLQNRIRKFGKDLSMIDLSGEI